MLVPEQVSSTGSTSDAEVVIVMIQPAIPNAQGVYRGRGGSIPRDLRAVEHGIVRREGRVWKCVVTERKEATGDMSYVVSDDVRNNPSSYTARTKVLYTVQCLDASLPCLHIPWSMTHSG